MADPEIPEPLPLLRLGLDSTAVLLHLLGPSRYLIADALGRAAFAVLPRRRRTTIGNFQMAFPQMGRRDLRRLARRSFCEYGRTSVDFLWVHRLSRPELMRSFRGFGAERVLQMRAEGKGGVLVLMHLGAWDAGGAYALARGLPLTTVMDEAGSRALQNLIVWARARIGLRAVLASSSARTLLRTLRAGGWVALLADIPGDTPSVEVDFLGCRTRFSTAPALLASRTGCPMVAVVSVRSPSGGYLVEVHPGVAVERDSDPEAALRPILDIFEAAVRRWPEQWFPFDQGRLQACR
ncbi:MAG: lysophospholipid acyltransferase family protein [Candidatus Dormibacteria bacterium]